MGSKKCRNLTKYRGQVVAFNPMPQTKRPDQGESFWSFGSFWTQFLSSFLPSDALIVEPGIHTHIRLTNREPPCPGRRSQRSRLDSCASISRQRDAVLPGTTRQFRRPLFRSLAT